MTLEEVANELRKRVRDAIDPKLVGYADHENHIVSQTFDDALYILEADPDFTLRSRIEKLAEEWESAEYVDLGKALARCLREALNPPKEPPSR